MAIDPSLASLATGMPRSVARTPSSLPVTDPRELPFVFATGIECSAPVIAGGRRHDQLVCTGHWTRYAEDAALMHRLGIPFVRYGIPFHVVAREPGRFDWTWTDGALDALREQGVVPIADLLHFGLPDDITGIGDPRLVERHGAFVEAFVARYPWVSWFTPVNEPYITSLFSGRYGVWNERGRDDTTFVHALSNILECAVRGAEIIRAARPDAVIVQSDACDRYTAAVREAQPLATFLQEREFVAFDLVLGRAPEPAVLGWLETNGMDEARVASLLARAIEPPFVVGLDYYHGNERLVYADQSVVDDPSPVGFGGTARLWLDRYRLPVMLTETNRESEVAVGWLDACWDDAMELRREGKPLVGFCWYSLTDQVDWDIALREYRGKVNSLGLVDLARHLRPVGERYAELASLVSHGGVPPLGEQRDRVA